MTDGQPTDRSTAADPLADRTAVVTGASSGIGRATARALARDGANVVLAARRRERLEAVADALESSHGIETLVVPTDVRDESQVEELIAATVEQFGELDLYRRDKFDAF